MDIRVTAVYCPDSDEEDGPVVAMSFQRADKPGHTYTNYYLCGKNDEARDALVAVLETLKC